MANNTFKWTTAVFVLCFQTGLIVRIGQCESVTARPFYRDHIYPHIVKRLGDPKPIRDVH
jgi:hypothetical protein